VGLVARVCRRVCWAWLGDNGFGVIEHPLPSAAAPAPGRRRQRTTAEKKAVRSILRNVRSILRKERSLAFAFQ
jgi:hypothetical protein